MQVSGLWRYPVKSLAGESLSTLDVSDWGPHGDRRWMVVDHRGQFLSQRQLPQMCRLHARQVDGGIILEDLSSGDSLRVVKPTGSHNMAVVVWQDRCSAADAGDEAARWLARRLGVEARLCYMTDHFHRQVDTAYAQRGDRVSFADGFPFLLCLQQSVDALSDGYGEPLAMERFRPNLVVEGAPPFAERQWQQLRIGDVTFDVVKPCTRCAIPTIDPQTGEREKAVFSLLREHCSEGKNIIFGQNVIQRGQGRIALGDDVEVLA